MAAKYFRKYAIPSATTETSLYEVPASNSAIVRSLRVTNTEATSTNVTVNHYAAGSATAHVLQKTRPVGAISTFDVFAGVPCVMEAGDILKVISSGANVTFYLSYLELDRD